MSIRTLHAFRSKTLNRHPIRLLDALYDSRSSLATDRRDKVFAILGRSFDASAYIPLPRYFESLDSIFQSMAESIMSTSQCLEIICLKRFAQVNETYAPDSQLVRFERFNGPSIGRSASFQKKSGLSPSAGQAADFRVEDDVLKAKGLFVGTVDRLSDTTFEADRAANNAVAQSMTTNIFYPNSSGGPYGALWDNFWKHRSLSVYML
jgi:hypothetical protein